MQTMSEARDPLLDAIQNYRTGMAAYNASSKTVSRREEEDALVSETYGPPMAVLDQWTAPATTYEGALEALRLARQEMQDFENSPLTTSLFAAAMAYLERLSPEAR